MINEIREIGMIRITKIIRMIIIVEMIIKMMMRLIDTDDKNNDSYKSDDK